MTFLANDSSCLLGASVFLRMNFSSLVNSKSFPRNDEILPCSDDHFIKMNSVLITPT